jgi:hypothetical protein
MEQEFLNLFLEIQKFGGGKMILNESVTYYQLRSFLTLLYKTSNDSDYKKMIMESLKILSILEVREKPIPTIKKLKSNSPEIFPED